MWVILIHSVLMLEAPVGLVVAPGTSGKIHHFEASNKMGGTDGSDGVKPDFSGRWLLGEPVTWIFPAVVQFEKESFCYLDDDMHSNTHTHLYECICCICIYKNMNHKHTPIYMYLMCRSLGILSQVFDIRISVFLHLKGKSSITINCGNLWKIS